MSVERLRESENGRQGEDQHPGARSFFVTETPADSVESSAPPVVSADDTVDEIVKARRSHTPLRYAFIQKSSGDATQPGPLKSLVNRGSHRALLLYLLALTKTSAKPWHTTLAAQVWARALDIEGCDTPAAATSISKALRRLEELRLIQRSRNGRRTRIHILKEDGSGEGYEHPGKVKHRYLRLPTAFWQAAGPEGKRWYRALTLPEIAMLLIALSRSDDLRLPLEKAPDWYGISADTASRGFGGLVGHGLLTVRKEYKVAPLSAVGYTANHIYTVQEPFIITDDADKADDT